MKKRRFCSIQFALMLATGSWGLTGHIANSDDVTVGAMFRLKNNAWAKGFEPFESDLQEIERLWGQPVSDDLDFIGGLDWPAWGVFFRSPEDPAGVVRGQARDRLHYYEGFYQAESGNYDVSMGVHFGAFELHGLDGANVLLRRQNQAPPVDYFFLVPMTEENVRLRPQD